MSGSSPRSAKSSKGGHDARSACASSKSASWNLRGTGRENKIYRTPPTPPPEKLAALEQGFVTDNIAVASISGDYSKTNPKLGPCHPTIQLTEVPILQRLLQVPWCRSNSEENRPGEWWCISFFISWSLMKSHEVSWNLVKSHDISWSLHEILWRKTGQVSGGVSFFFILWSLMKSREVAWNLVKCHEICWSLIKSGEVSWSLVQSHEISWNFVKCHEIS